MSKVIEYRLPRGWAWAPISELASYVQRGKSPQYATHSALPVINQKCVRWHGVDAKHLKFIHPTQWDAWGEERSLRDGDVLWNSTGTGTIGRAALYRPLAGYRRVVVDSHVTVLRASAVAPEYLHAWIRSPVVQSVIDEMQSGSTNQVELARSEVLATKVPVAPFNEQRRIVAKLESLQARSRRAREALDAVPSLLEKLRQSILAAAFRGDLTKDWRAEHRDVEPASRLLERIRAERREKWEKNELAKLKAKGNAPTSETWKAKYNQAAPADASGLPELPEGWCWASLDELLASLDQGWSPQCDSEPRTSDTEWAVMKTTAVQRNRFLPAENKRLPAGIEPRVDTELRVGDILITRAGPRVRAGVTCHVGEVGPRLMACDKVYRFRVTDVAEGPFVALYLNSPSALEGIEAMKTGISESGVNLTQGKFVALAVPVPPLREQAALVRRVADQLRVLDALTNAGSAAVRQLDALDRAVLAKAFRGELVPQDPSDEPAAVMLTRIRETNRTANGPAPTSGTRRTQTGGRGARIREA